MRTFIKIHSHKNTFKSTTKTQRVSSNFHEVLVTYTYNYTILTQKRLKSFPYISNLLFGFKEIIHRRYLKLC